MTSSESILTAEDLTKVFKVGFWGRRVTVLEQLNVEVRRGEVFGFLGPNGAGKTTTIKILMGLIYPTSGRATLFGRPISDYRAKARLGFLPESPYFYDYLTAAEFLRFYGHLFSLRGALLETRVTALLDLVGMTHARDLQLRKFSKGMLQRVGIAQALVNDPELVVLDEPMSGLDPVGRKEIRDLILRLKERGKTIFFSSHILHDAELLCDRVAIVMKGRLVACGGVGELVGSDATQSVEIVVGGLSAKGIELLRPLSEKLSTHGGEVVALLKSYQDVGPALEIIRTAKATLISLTPHKRTLEEIFIREVKSVQPRLQEVA
jgi:ABC-2 type transport system ATP-binding protein